MTDSADDITTRAASYAVGALTAAERRDVENDLRRSPRLVAEVREFTETAGMLGLATAPVAPSDAVRASILEGIDDAPQVSRVVQGPWFAGPAALLMGAAAAVVIAIGGTVVAVNLFTEPSAVDQIVAAADYERVSHEMDDGATVVAMWSESLERAAITVRDMHAPPADHTYQVWFIDEAGRAASAGMFDAGTNPQTVMLAGDMDAGDAIGITIEPMGGSVAPTTNPILVISTNV
jgi:anti-sigma-K factor RskA